MKLLDIRDRIRVHVLVKRKEGLSKEEFSRHWREVHGPLFAELDIVKKNVLKYEQEHISTVPSYVAEVMQIPESDYDGIALFEVETLEKLKEAVTSEEYLQTVLPDEERLFDRSSYQFFIAHVNTVIDK